jgi:hypothetical protein
VLTGIPQGTSDTSRLGDFIKLSHVSGKYTFDSAAATTPGATTCVRIAVILSAYQTLTTNFGSGLGAGNLFLDGSNSLLTSHFDPKLVKVLCDDIVTLCKNKSTSDLEIANAHCSVAMPFEYQTGLTVGTAANMYVVLIPFISGGTNGTTKAGTCSFSQVVTFQDG